LLSGQKVWRRRRPDALGEGAAATLQNRVEIPILNSEDPDAYKRTRSAHPPRRHFPLGIFVAMGDEQRYIQR
jgi:hypothetical protein